MFNQISQKAYNLAYSDGRDAFIAMREQSNNPYVQGTTEHLAWSRGWYDASIGTYNGAW